MAIGGVEFHVRRAALGWTVERAAKQIGVSRRTVIRWESTSRNVPDVARRWLDSQEFVTEAWLDEVVARLRRGMDVTIRLDRHDTPGHLPAAVQAARVALALRRSAQAPDLDWRQS